MKQVLTFVVLSFATLFLAAMVMLLLFFVKPEAFSIFTGSSAINSLPRVVISNDSLQTTTADNLLKVQRDSLLLDTLQRVRSTQDDDSLKILRDRLEAEMQKVAQLQQKLLLQSSPADSAHAKERKGIAKMLESMSAEDAARVLKNLKIDEAKKVLMVVKKRQAGKILSAMEPRLAAKMMK